MHCKHDEGPPFVRIDDDTASLSGSDRNRDLLSFVILSTSVDSRALLCGSVCGPDKSKGHSTFVRGVPDDVRFFGSPTVDFKDISGSEVLVSERMADVLSGFDEDIEVGKLEAAAERAKDKRAW